MNPILTALSQGYSHQQVLSYITRAFPQLAQPISNATKQGYDVKKILGFLSKNFDTENRHGMSESQRHAANQRADAERAKHGLSVSAGLIAAPLAAYAARNALTRALPPALQHGVGMSQQTLNASNPAVQNQNATASQPTQGMPPQVNPLQNPLQPPVNPAQNAQAPVNQGVNIPQQQQTGQVNLNQIAKQLNSAEKIKDLVKLGWNEEQITAYFNKFHPDIVKKAEKESGKTFNDFIKQYLAELPQEAESIAQHPAAQSQKSMLPESPPQQTEKLEEKAAIVVEPTKKKDIVETPQGIGEVKEIRNGKALIEIDGKLHKVDESEIEEPPLPKKELADLYDDLKSEIEAHTGEEVSRHVTLLGYDPNTKQLIYMPWRGQPYIYNDVTDDEIANLRDKIKRKTSGENFIGAYREGTESPVGAAMSEFIQKRKAEQKAKGLEKKENIHKAKYEKLYYAYDPAEEAADRQYKERKKQAKKNPRIP